jgi:hypothetical protein
VGVRELLAQRRTWVVPNVILGAIAGLPLVSQSGLGLVLFLGIIVAFTVVEQRFLAAGEGWHGFLLAVYVGAWFVTYGLFTVIL